MIDQRERERRMKRNTHTTTNKQTEKTGKKEQLNDKALSIIFGENGRKTTKIKKKKKKRKKLSAYTEKRECDLMELASSQRYDRHLVCDFICGRATATTSVYEQVFRLLLGGINECFFFQKRL